MVAKARKGPGANTGLVSVLFVLLLASLVLSLWTFKLQARHPANLKQYLLNTGEQRVLAYRIVSDASESRDGRDGGEAAFDRLRDSRKEFTRLMDELKNGSSEKGLPASPGSVQPELQAVESVWLELRSHVDAILNNQEAILSLRGTIDDVRGIMPDLLGALTSIATGMVEAKASQAQIYHATRQLFVAQRIDTALSEMLLSSSVSVSALDRITRDLAELKAGIHALLKGDAALDIQAVTDETVQREMLKVSAILGDMDDSLGMLKEKVVPDTDMRGALAGASDKLGQKLSDLTASYGSKVSGPMLGPLEVEPALITSLGAAAITLTLILGLVLISNGKKRARFTGGQDQRNQDAIRRLLDEMTGLADGDLSVETTVTPDITGDVAATINQVIQSMRGLVSSVNDTSVKAYSSVQENRATIMQLAETSEHQREQVAGAGSMINSMAQALTVMLSDATGSSGTAGQSVELAAKGADAVRQTISGMDKIGDRVLEASACIKRLDETVREAGDIVELTEDIADQTNVLALNAAMQAAVAGDAGRGFVVVADGVQRQAERFATVTKQIEAMVQAIQAEANKAVNSMEFSAAEVASGASLSENAGKIMKEIETVSQNISSIVSGFAESAQDQSRSADNINDSMGIIREIALQNCENTTHAVATMGELAEDINDLRQSVAGFALPDRA
jgi:twitching motility protein PilJ